MSLVRNAAILICAALPLWAAPRLTTIQDTIYKADGTKFSGTAVISWIPFDASDSSKIGLQSLTVQIINGAVHVQLVPNSDATPVNFYTVQYSSDGKAQFLENWSVPPSTATLRIKDVRVADTGTGSGGGVVTPPTQSPINESTVIGLLTDLSIRPLKGAGYGTGRVAVVDDTGAVNTANGNLSDCVHVDGTAGPCFDPAQLPAYSDNETPAGVVDGSNPIFTLLGTPSPLTSLSIYRNGLLQRAGFDYNVQSDGSLLFVPAAIPQPADVLVASYRLANSTGTLTGNIQVGSSAASAQVLCSSTGTTITGTASTSLGSCEIAANTLAVGDRVEIRFTLGHTGSTNGYVFLVRWGGTTLLQRSASALDSVVTGHGDASLGAGGTDLDMQTWGSVLPLASVVASASDTTTASIKVDFLAQMTAGGTDNVTLQNYTLLRYPAH